MFRLTAAIERHFLIKQLEAARAIQGHADAVARESRLRAREVVALETIAAAAK